MFLGMWSSFLFIFRDCTSCSFACLRPPALQMLHTSSSSSSNSLALLESIHPFGLSFVGCRSIGPSLTSYLDRSLHGTSASCKGACFHLLIIFSILSFLLALARKPEVCALVISEGAGYPHHLQFLFSFCKWCSICENCVMCFLLEYLP